MYCNITPNTFFIFYTFIEATESKRWNRIIVQIFLRIVPTKWKIIIFHSSIRNDVIKMNIYYIVRNSQLVTSFEAVCRRVRGRCCHSSEYFRKQELKLNSVLKSQTRYRTDLAFYKILCQTNWSTDLVKNHWFCITFCTWIEPRSEQRNW